MKKGIYFISFFIVCLFSCISKRDIVRAQSIDACDSYRENWIATHKVTFPIGKEKGFGLGQIIRDPIYPVVIGQDKDRTGVTLIIPMESYEGTVTDYRFDGYNKSYSDTCEYFSDKQIANGETNGFRPCGDNYFYPLIEDTSKPICTPFEKSVHRKIESTGVRVWLEPTSETRAWLGWGGELSNKQYPLRFIYPESLTFNEFTLDGGEVIKDPDSPYFQDIEAIMNDIGYDYLKSDPRQVGIPSRTLRQVAAPGDAQIGGLGDKVLGLFGAYLAWYGYYGSAEITPPCTCMIDGTASNLLAPPGQLKYDNLHGKCIVANDEGKGCTSYDMKAWVEQSFHPVNQMWLNLANIPMDLPGQWMIGIYFWAHNATDEAGREWESIDIAQRIFDPSQYKMNTEPYSFSIYILLSTPCSELDPQECKD
jgi:hypothetical protein